MGSNVDSNPFKDIYDALWTMVERNERLRYYLPEGNRIKYKEVTEPKHNVSSADRPELNLMLGGGKINIRNSSSTSSLTRIYKWVITTDSYKVFDPFETLGWELFRAMVDWDKVLCALTWKNQHYVKNATTIDIDEGLVGPDQELGIKGWTALWSCELELHFNTADLRIITN